jgi:hypothetical protein
MKPFSSVEEILVFLQTAEINRSFKVAIADGLRFAGQTDISGARMAVVLDAVLARGYEPDGFDQYDVYRMYRYKRSE